MANLSNLAKKIRNAFDMSDELERARYEFNKPRQFNPKITNFLEDVNYASNQFARGVPVVGKQTQAFADKLVTSSGGTNITKPKTEFGQKLGSVAELIPSTIALGGLGGAGKAAKIKNIAIGGGTSATIGGGLNKLLGGTFTEGAREGYKAAPVIQGIGQLTNPLLAKSTSRIASRATNPLLQQVIGRSAVGGANVLQGIPMNMALGQSPITPLSAAIDFGVGAVGGKRTFELPNPRTGNTAVGKIPQMHPEDAGVLDRAMDFLNNNKTKGDTDRLMSHVESLDTLATKYLKNQEIDKIVRKTRGKDTRQYYKEVGKLLQKRAGQVEPDFGFADSMLGVVGKNTKQASDVAPSLDDILRAETDVVASKEFNKSLPTSFKKTYGDWVNARRSTELEGVVAKKPFESADADEIEKIIGIQAGSNNNPQLRKYFDTKFKQLQDEGVNFNYREDYVPQLWDNSQEEIDAALGRRLSGKPSFSYERIIDDYAQGIAAGLKPRFRKLSDLVGWYESYSNKVLADKKFFSSMLKEGYIAPSSQAPREWVTLDPDRFKKYKVKTGTGDYVGDYKAPKEIADVVNNYLRPASPKLEMVGKTFSRAKNVSMTGGFPKSAINAHGLNILARNVLASKNPVEGLLRGAYYMINTEAGSRYSLKHAPEAAKLSRAGLTISAEDAAYTRVKDSLDKNLLKRLPSATASKWQETFEDPLFKGMLPALKLKFATDSANDLIKGGMGEEEAYKVAAKSANTIFGGMNYDELMRSKDAQNIWRTLILAPDWAEGNLRLGKGIVQGLLHPEAPEFKMYRTFARNLMGAYIAANVVNKALSGSWMFENKDGQTFSIDTGTYTDDGKKRYVRPFGTAVDFLRLPTEAVAGILRRDYEPTTGIVQNRINPLLASLIAIGTNRDYLGRPITSEANTQVENVASLVNAVAPVPNNLRAVGSFVTGSKSPEEAFMQATELPIRYRGATPNSEKERDFVANAQTSGVTGEEIYEKLKGEDERRAETRAVEERVQETGKEEMYNGVLYYMGTRTNEDTGKEETYLASLKVDEPSIGLEIADVESSTEKNTGLGKYIITNDSGKKSVIDLSEPIKKPEATGNTNLDKELVSRYNSAITTRINNIEKVYLDGQLTAEEAEKAISALLSKKISTKKKKGTKVSAPKISPIKVSSTKSSTKMPTLKFKSLPKAKIVQSKPKSIKIGRKKYASNKPIRFKNTLSESLTRLV